MAASPRSRRAIDEPAGKIIDAAGLAVAPGFIDIKTHSDFTLPINPKAESKVRQGVTTEIIGHCGFSVAPALAGKVELLRDYLSAERAVDAVPRAELSANISTRFPATSVNAGMLVGHNTLRLMVMGMEDRAPTKPELDAMIALLEEGLRAGALGMSSGLFTPPGSYARADEMAGVRPRAEAPQRRLLHPSARRSRTTCSKPCRRRSTSPTTASVHVEIVHFKCSGTDNWGKAADRARDDRRRQARAASTSIATPIPTPPAPIR